MLQWLLGDLDALGTWWGQQRQDTSIGYIRAARHYISLNYHRSLSLEDAAAYVGISPFYLCTLFKKELNKTYLQYVTDYRLDQAELLLRETGLPLEQIAERVGYQNPAYFRRVFLRHRSLAEGKSREEEANLPAAESSQDEV